LGYRRQIEGRLFCGEQFDDVQAFFESGGAVAADLRSGILRSGPGSTSFVGHEFFICRVNDRLRILPQNLFILNFH